MYPVRGATVEVFRGTGGAKLSDVEPISVDVHVETPPAEPEPETPPVVVVEAPPEPESGAADVAALIAAHEEAERLRSELASVRDENARLYSERAAAEAPEPEPIVIVEPEPEPELEPEETEPIEPESSGPHWWFKPWRSWFGKGE